jgi:hypothetical protein
MTQYDSARGFGGLDIQTFGIQTLEIEGARIGQVRGIDVAQCR